MFYNDSNLPHFYPTSAEGKARQIQNVVKFVHLQDVLVSLSLQIIQQKIAEFKISLKLNY